MDEIPKLPVFLCYRQSDGHAAARLVYELLNGSTVESLAPETNAIQTHQLEVYYDQTSAAQDDWTQIHEPSLKRARALILICTPGSYINEGENDWVHKELGWWLESDRNAPVLIDALGSELRYVPKQIAERWPNAQRIHLVAEEWENMPSDELLAEKERVKNRILSGIEKESHNWLKLELEYQKELARKLRGRLQMAIAATVLSLTFGIFAVVKTLEAEKQRDLANKQKHQVEQLIQRINFGDTNLYGIQSMRKTCDEAVNVTMTLTDPAIRSVEAKEKIQRFWQLYFGDMNLLELREKNKNGNSQIDSAMKTLGDLIDENTLSADPPLSSVLKEPANRLKMACANFIDELW